VPRRNRVKRAGGARFWVQLEHWLLDTPAWRHLSANARVIYVEIKRRYNGKNNGLISLSAREAGEAINATHHTGARALAELLEHGFLAVTEDSSFSRKVHIARQYRLTEVADDRPGFPREVSKDFLRWAELAPAKSKTQSHGCDATVAQVIRDEAKTPKFVSHSRMGATVKPQTAIQQSHPCDTIRLSASQPPNRRAAS